MHDERTTRFTNTPSLGLSLAFILIVPTLAHLLYSWMGFNPSDDGFILAGSRRILEGQIPHLDFISIRPAGSYYLHLPFVWLGGNYTLWLSRWFVWFELAATAWLAAITTLRILRVSLPKIVLVALALLAVCLGVNTAPIMAWHSYDAMLLAFLGLLAVMNGKSRTRLVGYVFMGAAPLCRQNFLLIPLAVLLLTGDWRQWRCWLAVAVPGILMLFFLSVTGALSQAWLQLTAQTGLYAAGIEPYLTDIRFREGVIVGVLGALFLVFSHKVLPPSKWRPSLSILGTLLLFITSILALSYLHDGRFLETPSMRIFGAALGSTLLLSLWPHSLRPRFRLLLIIPFIAWSVSVSIGYQTSSLAAGALAVLLILTGIMFMRRLELGAWTDRVLYILIFLLLIPTLFCFNHARRQYIYREKPANELEYRLGDVFKGGQLIYIDQATYNLIADLNRAVGQVGSGQYAIIPDFAAYWIESVHPNPLPLDWIQSTELPNRQLVAEVTGSLERQRGNLTVLVQKVSARFIAFQVMPLPRSERYEAVNYVIDNWTPVGETEYFRLYK